MLCYVHACGQQQQPFAFWNGDNRLSTVYLELETAKQFAYFFTSSFFDVTIHINLILLIFLFKFTSCFFTSFWPLNSHTATIVGHLSPTDTVSLCAVLYIVCAALLYVFHLYVCMCTTMYVKLLLSKKRRRKYGGVPGISVELETTVRATAYAIKNRSMKWYSKKNTDRGSETGR